MNKINKSKEFESMLLRKSFYFPSAEIYSDSLAGFYEFGPIGNRIRLNIIDFWRKEFVRKNNFKEIFGSLILPESVFIASGHLSGFDDPIATCSKCSQKYKLDKYISKKLNKEIPENLSDEDYKKLLDDNNIVCDKCGGKLEDLKRFNLMSSIDVGADKGKKGYLRGESCQSIFLDFLRIYKTGRDNLPIGISQQGLVYRNEISPRNGLLRCREFEQLESELFFDKHKIDDYNIDDYLNYKLRLKLLKDNSEKDYTIKEINTQKISCGKLITYYLIKTQQFLEKLGFDHKLLRYREVPDEDKAFYSKQTFDLEVLSNGEWVELFSLNYRTNYDLKAHSKGSKKELKVKENGKIIEPHVLEVCSIGLGRLFYLLLENNFNIKIVNKEQRNILSLKPRIAPYFVGVLPLVKKDGLLELAKNIEAKLLENNLYDIYFDEKGSIGKRYARLDEIGVPYCLTIDHQTKEDNTLTIRDRDSFDQKRIPINKLDDILKDLYLEKTTFKDI
jgi:glycyl-tRNA synthetase